jgi:hypothetical protein
MLSNRISHLAPPPRPVPLAVIVSAMMGVTGAIGAIFLVMGLAFTIVFTQGYRPVDDIRLALSPATAAGIINSVRSTGATENEVPVYKYVFTFTTNREQKITGESFTTGEQWSDGTPATIEYLPGDPAIARIQGTRLSEFAPWVLFILIFPAIGLAMFGWSAFGGLRAAMLFRSGETADARILSARPTSVSVNNIPVMEYFYEIRTPSGDTYNGSAKSLPSDRIGDEAAEPALYLPSNPSRSTLVDAIPLNHQLDVDQVSGQWIAPGGTAKVVFYILVWVGSIALGGFWILRTFGLFR